MATRSAARSEWFTTRWPALINLRGRKRLFSLLSAAGAAAWAVRLAIPGWTDRPVEAWSTSTAYVAFLLLAVSLIIGPLNVIRGRANPIHSSLRRDVGVTAGAYALLHTWLGLQVHMGGSLVRYFTPAEPRSTDGTLFVATNYVGLISALILVVLVFISTNVAIRTLGLGRWKAIQRTAYLAAAAATAHGIVYQVVGNRAKTLIALVIIAATSVLILQLKGVRERKAESLTQVARGTSNL